MRSLPIASLFISAALLAGCAGSKEHEVPPFISMPKDMDTSTSVLDPVKPTAPVAPGSAVVVPDRSAAGSGSW